ncbi:MAG: HAD-IC family P-type ATPase, partial [Acidobacteria bacterium]|nr:HAD-IC family P-type ATPase [Acidobacteriota bacterium]
MEKDDLFVALRAPYVTQPAAIAIGLSEAVAAERRRTEGPNELPTAKPKSNIRIAAEVLREPMFLLLIATGVVYLILGDLEEALALLVGIFVVIGITLYQQQKTERTLQALRDLSSPRALVIRDGQRKRIAGRDVVRGDLLLLSEGDRVPADAVVLSAVNLTIDESLLTGESVPVRKSVWDGKSEIGPPGGDDTPAVYLGTLTVQGTGLAEVRTIGENTEIGKLGRSLRAIEVQSTNLERETRRLVRFFASISVVLCIIVAVVYGLTTADWLQGVLAGLALAISLVPEEFPVVLTVFLALGAWRISRKRVLTRRISAIETLGSATVLCVDKTGTLTMNRMTVSYVVPAAGYDRADVLAAAKFASATDPVDPMERALHAAAPETSAVLVREYPLTGSLMAMSRVLELEGESDSAVFAKGAPEAVAQLCRLPQAQAEQVAADASRMAANGLRVLGVARAPAEKLNLPDSQEKFPFEFMGLVGLVDPIRPDVPAAIQDCYSAGVRVVMITGDFPPTAHNIAKQIGLQSFEHSITGPELASMPEDELRRRIRDVNIFARVLPELKLRLVNALRANGDVVAMTGDGVNDAPALKSANIGIAMGGRGTDVAREAASLVLL